MTRKNIIRVFSMALCLLMLLSVVAAIPAVAATDNATYEVGTVLHNINFTTMTAATGKEAIAKATGYNICSASTDNMTIGTEGWTINGKENTGYTDFTLTNANLPKNLKNYTVSVTFRWTTGDSTNQRVELVHDYSINGSNKVSNTNYTGTSTLANQTITPNGQFRYMNNVNSTYTDFEDAELKTVLSAADNRFVEVKCSYVDKKIEKIYFIYTASDTTTKTVEMTPDNVGVANPYFMFRVRQTADVIIKGIQVVSGSAAEQNGKNLIWPQGQQPDSIVNTPSVEVEETPVYENVLDPNRALPIIQKNNHYEDTAKTKYIPGYVLHNMDFSKIESWDKTGYFVTKDGEPDNFVVKDGVLKIATSQKMNIMLTGNEIPKNISNYTYTVKFRFAQVTDRHFNLFTAFNYDQTTGKGTMTGYAQLYCGNKITASSTTSQYEEDWAAQKEAMLQGEWITMSVSALDGDACAVVMECAGKTVPFIKTNYNGSLNDSYLGIRLADGISVEIASIQVVAGYYEDYTELVWPGEAGALVQNVTSDAIQKSNTENDTTNKEDETTKPSDETTKPSDETTKPSDETTAKDDTATTADSNKNTEKESGCKSTVPAFAGVCVIMAVALPLIQKKRRRD